MTIETTELPFPDSYWVTPGQLLAGEYPGDRDESTGRRKLLRMLKLGVDTWVDLTRPTDATPYLPWLQAEAGELDKEFAYDRFPILDYSIPSPEMMVTILDHIDRKIEAGHVVYVHCIGGIGRTGTVVGCHLVRHGMDGAQALQTIRNLRKNLPDWWVTSPESPDQKEMVLNWKIGQ